MSYFFLRLFLFLRLVAVVSCLSAAADVVGGLSAVNGDVADGLLRRPRLAWEFRFLLVYRMRLPWT